MLDRTKRPKPLTPAGSMFLDVVRFGAALAVAIGHLTDSAFSTGWPYLLNIAVGAVAIFFVLSGFVIRLITQRGTVTTRTYVVDRISRMYSVVLPALLFTILAALCLVTIKGRLMPTAVSSHSLSLEFLANVTFTNSLWWLDVPMNFNSAFWSLGYEVPYYVFYGLFFFGRGLWRWISLLVLMVIVGPPILFTLPLWISGCLLHDVYQKVRVRKHGLLETSCILVLAGLLAMALRKRFVLSSTLHRHFAAYRSSLLAGLPSHPLGRAGYHFYVVGIPAGLAMLWLLLLFDCVRLRKDSAVARLVRLVADSTFALYLLHLPLFVLIAAYVPYDHGNALHKGFMLSFVVLVSIAAAIPFDHFKRTIRRVFKESPEMAPIIVGVDPSPAGGA